MAGASQPGFQWSCRQNVFCPYSVYCSIFPHLFVLLYVVTLLEFCSSDEQTSKSHWQHNTLKALSKTQLFFKINHLPQITLQCFSHQLRGQLFVILSWKTLHLITRQTELSRRQGDIHRRVVWVFKQSRWNNSVASSAPLFTLYTFIWQTQNREGDSKCLVNRKKSIYLCVCVWERKLVDFGLRKIHV